jgi:hypothetical protein
MSKINIIWRPTNCGLVVQQTESLVNHPACIALCDPKQSALADGEPDVSHSQSKAEEGGEYMRINSAGSGKGGGSAKTRGLSRLHL